MPKREDESWANQQENLRYCTKHNRYYKEDLGCQLCWLEHQNVDQKPKDIPSLQECPSCGRNSLFWNKVSNFHECLNTECKKRFTQEELKNKEVKVSTEDKEALEQRIKSANSQQIKKNELNLSKNQAQETRPPEPKGSKRRLWFGNKYFALKSKRWKKPSEFTMLRLLIISLLFIFALSLVGWGISILVNSYIPFWLLLGFSVIYSIEKWLNYYTRKHKILGMTYRVILNLSVLSLFGLLIWSGVSLFTQQSMQSPLVGSLVFLGELAIFIWSCRIVSKNSWRRPSMKLTVFSLICLFLVFSFAGVQPIASYKDEAVGKVTTFFNEQKEKAKIASETNNSEQDVITEKNNESNGSSIISKSIDKIDNLWDTNIDDYANKFNQYRQSKGLTSLEFTDDLNQVAELRLKELYTNFSHYSAGNYNEHLAENIAMSTGFLSNSDALTMWQNSPGHNANMLGSSYKYTGYAIGNGYAVQVFTEYTTINGKPQLPPGWHWAD